MTSCSRTEPAWRFPTDAPTRASTSCSIRPTSTTCSHSPIRPGPLAAAPARDFDPGRVRVEALFRALYGDCRKGALAKTRKVPWVPKHGGGSVTFTTAQGADKALEAVSEELDRLPASFTKYLAPSAGTYNCRAIAGTERMSMHAYAAAIDINTKQTTYWQWVKPGADGLYHWSNKIPPEIVAAFEKHGFIWGGRWYHFDTMHFEYRPELLPRRTSGCARQFRRRQESPRHFAPGVLAHQSAHPGAVFVFRGRPAQPGIFFDVRAHGIAQAR